MFPHNKYPFLFHTHPEKPVDWILSAGLQSNAQKEKQLVFEFTISECEKMHKNVDFVIFREVRQLREYHLIIKQASLKSFWSHKSS